VEEVVQRLFALHATAASAYGFDRLEALKWLRDEQFDMALTLAERAFLEQGQGTARVFQGQVEAMWILAWSCGLVPRVDLARPCDSRFASMLPNLKAHQPASEWKTRAEVLPVERLFATCDLAYALHWAIRQARINQRPSPIGMPEDQFIERRRALEWLLSDETWDEVSLDT
jgi:hypothetical protein